MISKRQTIRLCVIATIVCSGMMMLGAQTTPQAPFDFSNAGLAEVRNDRGQVVLSGRFMASAQNAGEVERKAPLTRTGLDADASGEAEIEISGSGNSRRQEIEFEVRNLDPGGIFSFFIDNRLFATVTTDNRGDAKHEREVPMP